MEHIKKKQTISKCHTVFITHCDEFIAFMLSLARKLASRLFIFKISEIMTCEGLFETAESVHKSKLKLKLSGPWSRRLYISDFCTGRFSKHNAT